MDDTIQQLQLQSTQLPDKLSRLSCLKALEYFAAAWPGQVVFSTSFSMEDQVVTHLIAANRLPISIFTLDTGRLFAETYSVWSATNEKYDTKIKAYYPDRALLETYLNERGPNAFYESVTNRKDCCHIRKVEPLKRALQGQKVWITGLRAEHSPDRKDLQPVEWDDSNKVIKYHPLLHWDTEAVKKYIAEHNIPYNILHDKGFVSIGCAPCTRAIRAGEDFRAGRWWWEDSSKKECGLHVHAEGAAALSAETVPSGAEPVLLAAEAVRLTANTKN